MVTNPMSVCPKGQVIKKFDFHPWFGVYVTAELIKKQIDDKIVTYVDWYFDYDVSVSSQKTTLLYSTVFNYCKENSLPVPSCYKFYNQAEFYIHEDDIRTMQGCGFYSPKDLSQCVTIALEKSVKVFFEYSNGQKIQIRSCEDFLEIITHLAP